ncbi:energy transducer TonB [Sphingomonas echinoides]|uniref:TonB family protein n=1 Tax=Sphingomonas echinoides TaxID=59803 RepID=A0ABU4PNA5_9SPHN|nr:TonB family protein [Sphingomonas echinoides]MDX5985633.1 TonB family protein [Sphingomonas echinoides]
MHSYQPSSQDRIKGAGGAALLVVAIGYGLVNGLSVDFRTKMVEDLKAFVVAPPAPPPKPDVVPAPRQAQKHKEGAASPPNLKAKASEVVAPPIVLHAPPPPVVVAPIAGVGAERSAGAAPVIGPGTGSGGQGNGTGSGSGGDGDGGGGGEIPLRLIHGELRYRDLPRPLYEAGVSGTVEMEFDVGVKGRVTGCRITRSSGNAALDAATCQLIIDKLRYRPTRNAAGQPIPDTVVGEQVWTVQRDRD